MGTEGTVHNYRVGMSPLLLVTGAGTLGREVVRVMRDHMPVRVFSHGEDAMWRCEEMNPAHVDTKYDVEYVIGDIRDRRAVAKAMCGVTDVINTAAMKHIKYGVKNPGELIKTNIVGLLNLLEEASTKSPGDVGCFLQISTDKVANAENIYGTSKRMGEDMLVAWNRPNWGSLRFGNFLGSRGSVIDKWMRQIRDGLPITLTDRRMNRFFMKPREVAEFIRPFVLSPRLGPGDVAVPIMKVFNMGILADVFADHYGCEVVEIGAQPGEKVDERIISFQESTRAKACAQHYIISPSKTGDGLSIPLGTDVLPKQTRSETEEYFKEYLQ